MILGGDHCSPTDASNILFFVGSAANPESPDCQGLLFSPI
jgi:hypothetical protein